MSIAWWVIGGVAVWIACAVLTAGWFNAEMQRKFTMSRSERREELGFSIFIGILYGVLGPAGIAIAYLLTGLAQYGWTLRLDEESQSSDKELAELRRIAGLRR